MKRMLHLSRPSFIAAVVSATASVSLAAWNLPYDQLPKYNYSKYYHQGMVTTLKALPNYLKEGMTKGWTYYKGHYIMSNGLVNHMRKDGSGTVIGTNEAVSEGQGYGMLLAVLNNDQATFNKIFEAANQNMWDGGHKSYFKWQWPNNSNPGAATDADLDICTALIFADMLQKRSLWTKYDKGGVSYNSRAMEVMRSIRNNMTSNDYLLPGDNWQGSGINNLNPSYFATGFMKMFNAYQKELDFTKVIDKCYQVLQLRANQYNKGQAPDWISSSGGGASKGGLGMTVESIRAPWRIAMDAVWYNDSRAITFCKNAKNTLTQYAAADKKVLAQMAQYDENTNIVSSTAGLLKEISMWECSALGSLDSVFSKGCLTAIAFGLIIGPQTCFGDMQLSDHQYYYNQSLGMLGFALISGQFPNIYDDLKDGIPHVTDVAVPTASRARPSLDFQVGREGISFSLPESFTGGPGVSVGIYDPRGRNVLSRGVKAGGRQSVSLKNGMLCPGMYLLKLSAARGAGAGVKYAYKFYWN